MSADHDDIVDRIDKLVEEQLAQERSGYDHNVNQERCHVCGDYWHGLARPDGCPGAFANEAEILAWKGLPHTAVTQSSAAPLGPLFDLCNAVFGAFAGLFGITTDLSDTTSIARQLLEIFDELDIDDLPENEQAEARDMLIALRSYVDEGTT